MSELSQQVKPNRLRRRYYIIPRLQLGVTVGLAALAAAIAVSLGVFSYVSSLREIERIRTSAHLRPDNTWKVARPVIQRGVVISFGVVVIAGVCSSLVVYRRARRISGSFGPLFRAMGRGTPGALPMEAAAASSELGSAYSHFLQTYDGFMHRSHELVDHMGGLLKHMREHPDARKVLAQRMVDHANRIIEALDKYTLEAAGREDQA